MRQFNWVNLHQNVLRTETTRSRYLSFSLTNIYKLDMKCSGKFRLVRHAPQLCVSDSDTQLIDISLVALYRISVVVRDK